MSRALITGITGQDGSYLAEFLLSKGYEVHGLVRRASTFNTGRIDHIYTDPHQPGTCLFLHYGDLSDSGQLAHLVYNIRPDEVYHLAAQSHVRVSFDMPEYTGDSTGLGTTRLLEAIRRSGITTKFYQASSSEMFGASPPPQNERTPFYPRSPYAAAKVYAYWMTVNYREGYGCYFCLQRHSLQPRIAQARRDFVTRKITRAVASIVAGTQGKLYLGNLDALRDWGFAPEYAEMMWLMLHQDAPDDFVVGTGESHTVREFVEKAFGYMGVRLEWRGEGRETVGIVAGLAEGCGSALAPGQVLVEIDPRYFRPTEVAALQADISKAKERLGWLPRVTFDDLVKIMVDYDARLLHLDAPCEGLAISEEKGFGYTKHDVALNESMHEH